MFVCHWDVWCRRFLIYFLLWFVAGQVPSHTKCSVLSVIHRYPPPPNVVRCEPSLIWIIVQFRGVTNTVFSLDLTNQQSVTGNQVYFAHLKKKTLGSYATGYKGLHLKNRWKDSNPLYLTVFLPLTRSGCLPYFILLKKKLITTMITTYL